MRESQNEEARACDQEGWRGQNSEGGFPLESPAEGHGGTMTQFFGTSSFTTNGRTSRDQVVVSGKQWTFR